ncbi:MAG: hypothetical protein MN733_28035, partial [Nitrososphaera sp.]|nr:hypothetical protein [Nitrososphaera sp.]
VRASLINRQNLVTTQHRRLLYARSFAWQACAVTGDWTNTKVNESLPICCASPCAQNRASGVVDISISAEPSEHEQIPRDW